MNYLLPPDFLTLLFLAKLNKSNFDQMIIMDNPQILLDDGLPTMRALEARTRSSRHSVPLDAPDWQLEQLVNDTANELNVELARIPLKLFAFYKIELYRSIGVNPVPNISFKLRYATEEK